MISETVHLAETGSYTGNRCRSAWDSEKYTGPDPVTDELDEVTCRPCKARMVADGQCPECGTWRLVWSAGPVKLAPVSDGRLTMRDVETQFYLGCEECSETLIHSVSADQVAAFLTTRRWRP
jgi:hypothetical protein